MSKLSEKVSYLHGLAEGMNLASDSNEGKLIMQMLDLLSELISEIDDMHEEFDELNDYVESIDEDLSELEDALGGDDEDEDDDDDEDEFDFSDFHSLIDDEDDEDDEFADELFDDEDDEDDDEDSRNGVLDYFTREGELDEEEDEEDDEDGGMYAGCVCPKCGGLFCIDPIEHDEGMLYVCPHCKENVEATPMDNDNVPIAKVFNEDDEPDTKEESAEHLND